MKSSEELTKDIIRSVLTPILRDLDIGKDIDEVMDNIDHETITDLELYCFIEFIKEHLLAIRVAFRCDRAVAWELLRRLMKELDFITEFGKRCSKRLEILSCRLKDSDDIPIEDIETRTDKILEVARNFKESIETDYNNRRKE